MFYAVKYGVLLLLLWLSNSSMSIQAKPLFYIENIPITGQLVTPNTADLCQVANQTLAYMDLGKEVDPRAHQLGFVGELGFDLLRVRNTLAFICSVEAQDRRLGGKRRLQDIEFIRQHFIWVRVLPDKSQAAQFATNKPLLQQIPDDQLLLTKYYIKLAQGGLRKTPNTPHALYALPRDEQHLTLEQAEQQRDQLIRFRLTKQQVLAGAIAQHAWAKPLLWLSREDLEDTLMQGTVKVATDAGSRYFNVHRNNGIAYQRGLPRRQQQRYWYFKETSAPLGYGKDASHKIAIEALVTVAGDLDYFGLGKLIMLSHGDQHRLAILADTGGAFVNNHYQLDYLAGYFSGWDQYVEAYRQFPDYFEVRILMLKSTD